jgi:8-oxo-dGTP diphosphatase
MVTSSDVPDARPVLGPGDAWVHCACGRRHWGTFGAAGVMLWRRTVDPAGERVEVLLQHRALWTHHGGTWGIPGGARRPGETATAGALREAAEEAGIPVDAVRVRATRTLEHPDWSYTTVLAEAVAPVHPRAADAETLEAAWVDLDRVGDRDLLPAFADALPELTAMLRTLVLVVDAANVVGSRPDGWWTDRAGATARLRDHLADLARAGLDAADVGLPGQTWYPEIVLVTEGRARDVAPADGVRVIEAPGSGDDAIVEAVRELGAGHPERDLAVTTADRELRERVRERGARVLPPRLVRH